MDKGIIKALVIDDSPTDAETLSYWLTKKLGCAVEIVTNGLDGLNKLAESNFDVVFLDIVMPFIDGVEVLREIRGFNRTAHLPVIIISSNTDSKTVRSLMQLKIFDYVVKPFNAEKLISRLSARLAELKGRQTIAVSMQLPGEVTARGHDKEIIMIADDDANFRHFFAATLGARFHVMEAANGAQAIAACMKHRPVFFFSGPQIGIFDRDRLIAKLRGIPSLADLKVFAIDAGDEADFADKSLYDGRVKRTFITQAFIESFNRCVSGAGADRSPARPFESVRQFLISATEQVFGMMMSTEVCVDEQQVELDAGQPGTHGVIELLGYKEGKRAKIEFCCDRACVVAMAMRMLQMEEAEAANSLELAHDSFGEVLNMIAGRMRNSLGEESREFDLGLPRVEERVALEGSVEFGKHFKTNFSFGEEFYFSVGVSFDVLSTREISASDIHDGMVLARALDFSGGMQLSKGRRLSVEMITEIRRRGVAEIEVFESAQS